MGLQSKAMALLKEQGFYVIKVGLSNRNGTPDLIACSPSGGFYAFECKEPGDTERRLQRWHIEQIRSRGGVAIFAHSLDDVREAINKE